jgi:hypothetical protein
MTVYLQHSTPTPEMWSGLPRYIPTSAHDWGQMLTFEGKICSLSRAFTTVKQGMIESASDISKLGQNARR